MMPDVLDLLSAADEAEMKKRAGSEAQQRALAVSTNQVEVIEKHFGAAVLQTIAGTTLGELVQGPATIAFREQFLAGIGSSSDPIETALAEQFMWSHYEVGNLHVKLKSATSPEVASIYCGMITKLAAESRKTALAIREYGSPITPKQVTLVKQQNLAAGNQQVAMIDGSSLPYVPKSLPLTPN
jgi:hypothetical protein